MTASLSVSPEADTTLYARPAVLPLWLTTALFWLPVVLTCAWVLLLPMWPSQDGPLHLYYVNILKQLMAHQPGPYLSTFYIKSHITPYSTYYYGLLALNRVVSLETADKLMVCLYLVAFAGSTRALLRAVSGGATWASFLCLPVLLNWPLVMGFVNYSLSTCLGFIALALWCRNIGQQRRWPRALFLLLICLMIVTHPVPWMIVVSFALLELAVRLLRSRSARFAHDARPAMRSFPLDAVTAALACVPYLYLHHFSSVVQTLEPPKVSHETHPSHIPHLLLPYVGRAQMFLRTLGVDVFVGGSLLPRLYRVGVDLLLVVAIGAAIYGLWRSLKRGEWTLSNTWLLFAVLLLPFLLFLPDPLQGRYFFAARMGILLFVALVAAASSVLRQSKAGMAVAAASVAFYGFVLALAVHYITPAARTVATLREAPVVQTGGMPGLSMMTAGAINAPGLNFNPDNWATAQYYRRNNLVIYNTAWLGDPIILVGVRPEALHRLDETYFESVPWFGSVFLPSNDSAAAILRRVGFVIMMRQNAPLHESPFAAHPGDTASAPYAHGWTCKNGPAQAWYLCLPPATR